MSHDPTAVRTAWSQQQADALIRYVQMLPPAPMMAPVAPDIFDRKCLCGEKRDLADFPTKRSKSGVEFREAVCRQCPVRYSQWERLATVICATCRTEIIRLAPHQDKSGFRYEPGGIYHTLECSSCKKGIDRSPIVEKTLWDKQRFGK